jgi:hypothetical protein
MQEWLDRLDQINSDNKFIKLEHMPHKATTSGMVSDHMCVRIPVHCESLVTNKYHNGHPDLLPRGVFPGDSAQRGNMGIEVKASRTQSWQAHSAVAAFLMVFGYNPFPTFHFTFVVGAQLEESDWKFNARKPASRRCATADLTPPGRAKMKSNWIYALPEFKESFVELERRQMVIPYIPMDKNQLCIPGVSNYG